MAMASQNEVERLASVALGLRRTTCCVLRVLLHSALFRAPPPCIPATPRHAIPRNLFVPLCLLIGTPLPLHRPSTYHPSRSRSYPPCHLPLPHAPGPVHVTLHPRRRVDGPSSTERWNRRQRSFLRLMIVRHNRNLPPATLARLIGNRLVDEQS